MLNLVVADPNDDSLRRQSAPVVMQSRDVTSKNKSSSDCKDDPEKLEKEGSDDGDEQDQSDEENESSENNRPRFAVKLFKPLRKGDADESDSSEKGNNSSDENPVSENKTELTKLKSPERKSFKNIFTERMNQLNQRQPKPKVFNDEVMTSPQNKVEKKKVSPLKSSVMTDSKRMNKLNKRQPKPKVFHDEMPTSPPKEVLKKNTSLLKSPVITDSKPIDWSVGDIVWGKVSGHPWWPCKVGEERVSGLYTKMQGEILS